MPSRIRVVDRVVDILSCFTPESPELGVSEISQQLGLDKATVWRILFTLKSRGFVRTNSETQKYSIGPLVLQLAQVAMGGANLRSLAFSYCLWLRDQTGETAALTVREGFSRFCLEQVESRHEIKRSTELGKFLPLHCGASGKLLLAHMPEQELDRFFAQVELTKYTEDTIIDVNALIAQLRQIREQGYAVSMGERVVGSVTIATPVRDHRSQVVAALSVAMPLMRYRADRLPDYVAALETASGRLSCDLGYYSPSNDSRS